MFVANLKEIGLILTEIELLLYTRFEKVESQTGNLFTYNTRGGRLQWRTSKLYCTSALAFL